MHEFSTDHVETERHRPSLLQYSAAASLKERACNSKGKKQDTLRRQNRLRPGHREDDPFNIRKYKIFLCKGIISKTFDRVHLEEEASAIVSYAKVICLAVKTEVT